MTDRHPIWRGWWRPSVFLVAGFTVRGETDQALYLIAFASVAAHLISLVVAAQAYDKREREMRAHVRRCARAHERREPAQPDDLPPFPRAP